STPRKAKRATAKKTVSRARKKETVHVVLEDKSVVSRRRPRSRSFASLRRTSTESHVAPPTASGSRRRLSRAAEPALPSWKDLDRATNGRVVVPKSHACDSSSTLKIAGIILGVGVAVTAYVGHVQATQDVLSGLQTLRAEGASLRLELNSIRGEYDRLTGPAEIRH